MTNTASLPQIPAFHQLYAYRMPLKKTAQKYDALFEKKALEYLQEHATTIKRSQSALWNNTYWKLGIANVTYLAHGLVPAAVLKYGIDTNTVAQYADFIKEQLPSALQTWISSYIPSADQPCLIPQWVHLAATIVGCGAFLSLASHNRKTVLQRFEKQEDRLEEEIAYVRNQRFSELQNIYNQAVRALDQCFAKEAANDPNFHEKLWEQASTATPKLPYLREALANKGLSPLESSLILRKFTSILQKITNTEVGLQNSDKHTLYNAKFLANFSITPENCIPKRAQHYLAQAKKQECSTGISSSILPFTLTTTIIAASLIFAATYVHPPTNNVVQATKRFLECSWNHSATPTTDCWANLPISEVKWTATAAFATAFATCAISRISKWYLNKISSRKALLAPGMTEAVALTKQVYDDIATYLHPEDVAAPHAHSASSSTSSSRPPRKLVLAESEEKTRGSGRPAAPAQASKEQEILATAINRKMDAIHTALAGSGLKGCQPEEITENLRQAVRALLTIR